MAGGFPIGVSTYRQALKEAPRGETRPGLAKQRQNYGETTADFLPAGLRGNPSGIARGIHTEHINNNHSIHIQSFIDQINQRCKKLI